ncbi:hypothetical protein LJC74_03730 [Eubacteriales bacterium OttesenSCG-928-A19]|nr:hypothetical protein [Eubacteriales bacterium OttesenSCG-928-A19]
MQWKKGLRNCKWPSEGKAAVVMEYKPGRRGESEKSNDHEHEPDGLRIGIFLDDALDGFWVDENRFEPYIGGEELYD